jgi:YHS domain-containing protein
MRCETCKKIVDKSKMIVYSGKNVCFCSQTCYTSFLSLEKEKEDRNFLYKDICRIFGIGQMTEKLYSQVKRLKDNEKLSYKNIRAVLHYMYDIQGMPIYSPTLYYVPENVERAKEYYLAVKVREQKAIQDIAQAKEIQTAAKVIIPNYNKKRASRLKIDPNMV